jgi:16S rRNA (uracil1498-N3)-methyltransferase
MPVPRLFVEASLAPGAAVTLNETQARYLQTVLRLGPGARALLFNGVDGEWAAEVKKTGKRDAGLVCVERTRAQTFPPDLVLLFAPVKRQGTDLIAEKATELGVRVLQPVLTRRTQSETVRADRLRAIAIEAAEQTERLDVPEICEAAPLGAVLGAWDKNRRLLFADEAGEAAPIAAAVSAPAIAPAGEGRRLALLIGPEGGFEPDERRLLRALPFVTPVSLGPRILRAETAVIAALALIQAHWGDW